MFKDVTDILCLNVASGQYANTLISYSDVPVAAGLQMICCQQHAWKDQPSQWQNAAVRRCDRNSSLKQHHPLLIVLQSMS